MGPDRESAATDAPEGSQDTGAESHAPVPRENGPDEGTAPDDDPLVCVACGATIDRAEWHPVRTRTDADGEFHIDAFCSKACREQAERERSDSA